MQRRAAHCAVPRTSAMMHRPSSVKLFSSSDRPESFAEPRSNSACGKGNAPSACVAINGAELLCGELLCCADHCRRVRVVETDRVQQDGLQRLAIGHSDKRLRRRQCRVRCGAARQSSTAEQRVVHPPGSTAVSTRQGFTWFLISGSSDANCLLPDRSSVTRLGSEPATLASSSVSSFLVSMVTRFGTAGTHGGGAEASGRSKARMSVATFMVRWNCRKARSELPLEPLSRANSVGCH